MVFKIAKGKTRKEMGRIRRFSGGGDGRQARSDCGPGHDGDVREGQNGVALVRGTFVSVLAVEVCQFILESIESDRIDMM